MAARPLPTPPDDQANDSEEKAGAPATSNHAEERNRNPEGGGTIKVGPGSN